MNRKQLCVMVALAIGAGAVSAQDYDNRWYIAPRLAFSHNDNERFVDTDDTVVRFDSDLVDSSPKTARSI